MSHKLSELKKQLENYEGEDQIISYQELLKELKAQPGASFKFPTGYDGLDKILDGVEAGELVVITGPTGQGKTTLAISITKRIARDTRVAWFTLEITQRQFSEQMGKDVPVFWLPRRHPRKDLKWLTARITEAKAKHDIQAVFIDHIGMLETQEKFYGEHRLELKHIVGKLKELAINLDIAIFLLAHITEDTSSAQEPHHTQIRDSRDIAHLCDSFICIWRIGKTDDGRSRYKLFGLRTEDAGELDSTRAKIKVTKNRRKGKLGTLNVKLRDKGDFVEETSLYGLEPEEQATTDW